MTLRSIIACIATTAMLAACADRATPTGSSPTRSYPAGADDLVMRWGLEGGFTPPAYQLTNLPAFSLYGDGTIVRPGPQIEIYPAPAVPSIEVLHVDEAGVAAIVDAAFAADLDTVGDLGDMGSVGIADAPDTVFVLHADGVDRTVRVYALGEVTGRPQGMPDDVLSARRALLRLVERLGSLEQWLPDGSLGAAESYEPAGARVYVTAYHGDADLPQPRVPWPLATPLAGIGEDVGAGFRCVVVTGAEWSDELGPAAAGANQLTPWSSGGERYAVAFRPLLPDETTC